MNPWRRIPVPCCSCGECAIREEYKQWHKFSRAHARGLIKLAEAERRAAEPVDRVAMGLTNSEYGNFAAMRWWGLIESFSGNRWALTDRGWRFLHGLAGIPKRVLTFRGCVFGVSIGLHKIRELTDADVWERAQYLANRIHPTAKDYRQLALTV